MAFSVESKRKFFMPDGVFAVLMALPAVAVLSVTVFFPILKGIYVSFCDYTITSLNNPGWNNFANYAGIFKNGEIFGYFKTTFIFVFFCVIIQFALGFSIALLLNSSIRGRNVFRGLFLIPWTIPSVVVALLWRWMLHQQFGVINYLLYNIRVTDTVNISWLLSPVLAMASILLAAVWRQLPYMMVMILAALQSVDQSLIEAAKMDGVSLWGSLVHVTIPSIRPVIISTLWIAMMNNFQMYTIISLITGGGPVNATTTLSLAAYRKAFQSYDFGQGSAIGVLWLALLFVITLVTNRLNDKYAQDL
jgi:multiple sugar transport system permease protein